MPGECWNCGQWLSGADLFEVAQVLRHQADRIEQLEDARP